MHESGAVGGRVVTCPNPVSIRRFGPKSPLRDLGDLRTTSDLRPDPQGPAPQYRGAELQCNLRGISAFILAAGSRGYSGAPRNPVESRELPRFTEIPDCQ